MILAIEVLPTPLFEQSDHNPGCIVDSLWPGDECMFALFHPQVQTSDQLLATPLGACCSSCGSDNWDALDQQVVRTDNDVSVDF